MLSNTVSSLVVAIEARPTDAASPSTRPHCRTAKLQLWDVKCQGGKTALVVHCIVHISLFTPSQSPD